MGIEPTKDPCEPFTDFEDQGRHQAAGHLRTYSILLLSEKKNKN